MEQNNQLQEEYQERKNKVVEYLLAVSDFLSHNEDKKSIVESIDNMAENVEKGLFSIVLVGEFSAGKSTFLNALMGKRILPSFTRETTATVNFLCHKSKAPNGEAGIVYYKDGSTKTISDLSLETIEKVVSTRGDKDNEKIADTVDKVDLFLDSKFLKNGVMLVDSPGLNGIAAHHKEITEQQIKRSHASIFMFSADHPGSKTDFEYLRELKEQSSNNNIFFVLNKINVIKKSEGQTVQSVINELKQSYHKQFPDEAEIPEIWPVAANAALAARNPEDTEYQNGEIVKCTDEKRRQELEDDSLMKEFENRLWKYLTKGEKARAELESPLKHVACELNAERNILEKQREILSAKERNVELDKKQELLEKAKENLEQKRLEQLRPLKVKFNEAFKDIKNKISADCDRIVNGIVSELDTIDEPQDLTEYTTDSFKENLDRKYRKIFDSLNDTLREDLRWIVQSECADYFAAFEDSISDRENISFKLVPSDWQLTQVYIKSNLAETNKILDEKRKQLEEAENKLAKLQSDSFEAKRQSEDKRILEKQINKLKEERNRIKREFILPDIEHHTEKQKVKVARRGLFGALAWICNGAKYETVEKTIADDSKRKHFVNNYNEQKEELDNEISKLENELKNNTITKDYATIAPLISTTQRKLDKLEKEFDKLNKDSIEKINKNNEKAARIMKRNIRNFLDDRSDEIIKMIKKALEKEKANYFNSVQELINSTINNELNKNVKQLEKLKAIIAASDAERDAKLKQVETDLAKVKELLNRGIELSSEIETTMTDKIEQQAV